MKLYLRTDPCYINVDTRGHCTTIGSPFNIQPYHRRIGFRTLRIIQDLFGDLQWFKNIDTVAVKIYDVIINTSVRLNVHAMHAMCVQDSDYFNRRAGCKRCWSWCTTKRHLSIWLAASCTWNETVFVISKQLPKPVSDLEPDLLCSIGILYIRFRLQKLRTFWNSVKHMKYCTILHVHCWHYQKKPPTHSQKWSVTTWIW